MSGDDSEIRVALTGEGAARYKLLQREVFSKFALWMIAGAVAGGVTGGYVGQFFQQRIPQAKLKKYRLMTFFALFMGLSYHGSKLARIDFHRGRKEIFKDKNLFYEVDMKNYIPGEDIKPAAK